MTEKPDIICKACGKKMRILVTGGTRTIFKDQYGYTLTGDLAKPSHIRQVGVAVDNDKKNAMEEAGEDGIPKHNVF
jgi:hypothetical protein